MLVSYSYFEKDAVQLGNAEFFWKVGMGLSPGFEMPSKTDFVVVVSGELCTYVWENSFECVQYS